MKPENRKQLVRGYVVACTKWEGGTRLPPEPDAPHAYTFWYRHDDDLKQLERELRALVDIFSRNWKFGGAQFGYEYKPYRDQEVTGK